MVNRTPRFLLVLLVACGFALMAPVIAARPRARSIPSPGLRVALRDEAGGQVAEVVSSGRFALLFDRAGIVAWYDLQRDPAQAQNLVPPGARLLEHRRLADDALLDGQVSVEHASPVAVRLRYQSDLGDLVYSVWAGGQVGVELRSAGRVTTRLRFDQSAVTGAVLQPLARGADGGKRRWSYLLYLDAWTPDDLGSAPGAPAPQTNAAGSFIAPAPLAGAPLRLVPPPGAVRQPRFQVAGWLGPQVSVSLGGRTLVEGVDYLAGYDPAQDELSVQYLRLLPPGDDATRTFTLTASAPASALALQLLRPDDTVRADVSEAGMLRVDANLPSGTASASSKLDVFDVPYIQPWPELRARAVAQSPPVGFAGVRFLLTGLTDPAFQPAPVDDLSGPDYEAVFMLPRRAEYRLEAVAIDAAGNSLGAPVALDPLGYGRIFLSVGDSITAGKWGFYRLPPGSGLSGATDGYPFTSPPTPGGPYPVSVDRRNYPQLDNTQDDQNAQGDLYENIAYQGFQVDLNNNLAACLRSPVFVVNSGWSGLRTARDRSTATTGTGTRNLLVKQAAYRK